MNDQSNAGVRAASPTQARLPASMVLVALIVFIVMAGFDTDNALQVFDDPLGSAIDTIEAGNLVRRIAMFLLAVSAVVSLARNRTRPPHIDLVVAGPLVSLLLLALLSPVWAIDRDITFRRVVVLVLLVLGAYAFAERLGVLGLTKLTLVVSATIVASAITAQVAFGSFRPFDGSWRLAGVVHPVALSWYSGLGAMAAIALSRQVPRRKRVLVACSLAFLGVVLLTRTRTGLAGAVVGIAALVFLSNPRKLRQRIAGLSAVLGLALFGVVLAAAMGLTWSKTYGSLVEITSLGRSDAVDQIDTFTGRLPVWVASLQLAAERPLLGYGYNAFSSPEMLGEFARASGWVPTSTHSGYVESLLDLGVIGLALLVTIVAGGVSSSLRLALQRPEFSFAVAALLWLGVNLFLEAAVLFDANFVSFLVFALLFEVGLFSNSRSRSNVTAP